MEKKAMRILHRKQLADCLVVFADNVGLPEVAQFTTKGLFVPTYAKTRSYCRLPLRTTHTDVF